LFGAQHMSNVATEPLVAQTAPHVLVARHEPARPRLVVEDRRRFAEPIEDRIRILEERGIRGVEGRPLEKRHAANHTARARALGESGGGTKYDRPCLWKGLEEEGESFEYETTAAVHAGSPGGGVVYGRRVCGERH